MFVQKGNIISINSKCRNVVSDMVWGFAKKF